MRRRKVVKGINPEVILAIVRHQQEAIRPGREICGRIVFRNGIGVSYERYRNYAKGDGVFQCRCPGSMDDGLDTGEFGVLLHSHPDGPVEISDGDLMGVSSNNMNRPYAIYGVEEGVIQFYTIFGYSTGRKDYTTGKTVKLFDKEQIGC